MRTLTVEYIPKDNSNLDEIYCTLCPRHCLLGVLTRTQEHTPTRTYTDAQMHVIWDNNGVIPSECPAPTA